MSQVGRANSETSASATGQENVQRRSRFRILLQVKNQKLFFKLKRSLSSRTFFKAFSFELFVFQWVLHFVQLLQVAKGVLTNPILLLTVLGVICSFAFGGQLPAIIATFLKTLGSAFSATALFLLGLRMVNKMDHFKGAKIIAPLILIALKLIAMPVIAREVVRFVQHCKKYFYTKSNWNG